HAYRLRPARRVGAGAAQRPLAELVDEVRFLGGRDERRRRDVAAIGMLPTHQRLEADDDVILGPDDRLIMQLELVRRERLAQVVDQQAALFLLVLEVGRIEAELPAPAVLRGIESEVRRARDLVALEPVVGRNRDADAGADDRALAVDRIGLRDDLDDLPGQLAELAAIVEVGEDDLELVPAETPDLAAVADDIAQP